MGFVKTPSPQSPRSKLDGCKIEQQALQYVLKTKSHVSGGIQILEQNYRCRVGEIDLIFTETPKKGHARELVFLEVRGREAGNWQSGVESVGPSKRRRIEKTARWYLRSYQGEAVGIRFDVLAWDQGVWTYLENAWHPG